MSRLRAFVLFWWDFVIGDDWVVAAGVVLTLGVVALLAHAGLAAWWIAPPGVLLALAATLRRATARG